MNEREEMALWLLRQGCSVIPIEPRGKKPLASVLPDGKWRKYQTQPATVSEVSSWFSKMPDANIALVCGDVSGIVAVDVDGSKGQKWFRENLPKPNFFQFTSSKNKFHAFFKHPGSGVTVPPAVRITEQVDVRGDGSYVVFAPSVHESGAVYSMRKLPGFDGMSTLVPMPDIKLKTNDPTAGASTKSPSLDAAKGERNEKLAQLCGRFYARNCTVEEILAFAHGWNSRHCDPPLSEREIETTVRSMASTHLSRNPQALNNGSVSRWVSMAVGDFTIADIYRDLGISGQGDKAQCQNELRDLVKMGQIESCKGRAGWYRKCEKTLERIDLNVTEAPEVSLWLPFGLYRHVKIQPKNVIVVAGETNSGKTGLLFNLMAQNLWRRKFRYIASEMTANEINDRIFTSGVQKSEWEAQVEFVERSKNYADAVDPDGLNIVDYLEIHENFSLIGSEIKKIFDTLKNGVAFIAIQKRTGELFGRGGEFTLEKARLGLSLFTHGRLPNGVLGSVKVTKAKNFRPGMNPEGMEQFYRLFDGFKYDNAPIPLVGYKRGFNYVGLKDRESIIRGIESHCKDLSDGRYAQRLYDFYGETIQGAVG
jgi:hypothetical protein